MKNIELNGVFTQIDAVGKFFNFRKKVLIKEIKKSLETFALDFSVVSERFEKANEKVISIEKTLEATDKNLKDIQDKYDLSKAFLSAKPIKNDALSRFKSLVNDDFIEFANNESALAEEAKALLILQDVEKRLEKIVNFSSIYNKNIVAVGGGFSAGKSEFLNSLFVDKQIQLPVGINPVTAIPTYITVGKENKIRGYSYQGGVVELSASLYKQLSHDFIKSLGFNLKDIAPIMAIETPMESYTNICFIDTPGYNPSNTGYTSSDAKTSQEYLEHANTLLWTIGIDTNGTIPSSDLAFLENISMEDKKIYVIANKADLRSEDDIDDILDIFEEILDEYDIEYEGISAFSSINKEEIIYRKESLFDFLERVNNPVEVKGSILSELDTVFDMYDYAIREQIEWTKGIQSHFKSLELDLLESGIDIDGNEKVDERLEKMRDMFKTSHLNTQLKDLESIKINIKRATEQVFDSIISEE